MSTTELMSGPLVTSSRAGMLAPVRDLLPTIRPHIWLLVLGVLSTALRFASTLGGIMIGAYIVGRAVNGAGVDDLKPWLIALGALVLGRGIAYWLEMWVLHDAAYRILADLRYRLYLTLERLAPSYLLDRRSGDLASTAMADVEAAELFYAHTLNIFISVPLVILGTLAVLAWIQPWLALTMLPAVVLGGVVSLLLRNAAVAQGRAVRDLVGEVNAEVVDAVQGLREIVTFGRGQARLDLLEDGSQRLIEAQFHYARRKSAESAMLYGLRALTVLAVLAVAAKLVADGALSSVWYPVAIVTAFYIFEPIQELNQVAQNLGQTFAALRRVRMVYDAEPLVCDLVEASPLDPIEPRVRFEDVSFRYAPTLPDALCGATFEVAPGETIALVGHSGAGKSTCINLLLRFWDVTGGAVTIGGHDLRSFRQTDLRELIALVPQDIYLFNTSIRENIRLGRPDATDAEVIEASRLALADVFISELPDGYETQAGERAVQLSGGQRQRLAIARALLKDAPILILDEAVSNLDAENELALKQSIDRVRAGRTTLIIAHRLSTIRDADRIVVLDGRRVTESGTHEELLQLDGAYSTLIAAQRDGLLIDEVG